MAWRWPSASYTTAATTVADNATRYTVRATNAAGNVTSAEAVLTVQAATGGLVGRAPPRPVDAVVPMAGGTFKSSIKNSDTSMVLRIFTQDAEITCSNGEKASPLPWVAWRSVMRARPAASLPGSTRA